MIVPALIAVALLVAFVPAVLFGVRRRQTPVELRGDWWSRFEAEFRAYAARTSAPPRRGQRHGDIGRQPPPR